MPAPTLSKSPTPGRWINTKTKNGTLTGGDGNEHLQAFAAGVTLTGGKGGDTYAVYDSNTKIVEQANGGIDTVITYGTYRLSANLENLVMHGAGNDWGSGNSGNNLIIDGAGNDHIETGGGNDVITLAGGANEIVANKAANSITWVENFKTSGSSLDKLDLRGFGFQGFATVQAKMSQVGADVKIDLGNGQMVMLEDRTVAQIVAGNVTVEAASTTPPVVTPPVVTPPVVTPPVTPPTTPPVNTLPSPNAPLSGMKMTFDEEFNSLSMRTGTGATANNIWKTSDGWGNRTLSGNAEKQLYVDPDYKGLGLNPFSIDNGILTITASKTPSNVRSQVGYDYISGELTTAGSFAQQYGYFEMKAQMAPGKGMWPAFWMLSTNGKWPPEIDIVEAIGGLPNHVYVNTHSGTNSSAGKDVWSNEDITKGFHTYGVDWTKDFVTFYYDGKEVYKRATPADFHTPMYMLVNLAVGGNWPGSPDGTTDWSKTQYKIDYVRAWSHDPNAAVYQNVPSGSTPAPTTPPATNPPADASNLLKVVLGNGDAADTFTANGTAKGTSSTYSTSQMDIAGVTGTVTVGYDANGGMTVTNNGVWNAIKTATVNAAQSGSVTINNFVEVQVTRTSGDDAVTVRDAKRGTISTGAGNDTIDVTGASNLNYDNVVNINAGDGNDTVKFAGTSITSVKIDGGAGDDRIEVGTHQSATVSGGAGADVFSFIAGAHATITDFNSAADRIELKGVSASSVHVTASGGSTLIDLGGGASITLSGVSLPASSLNLAYAA